MATTTTTERDFEWPEEVVSYAVAHGFDRYLQPVLEMTRRVFPTALGIQVALTQDGDIPDLWFVVFEVIAAGMTLEQLHSAHQKWTRECVDICPVQPDCYVVLGLEEAS